MTEFKLKEKKVKRNIPYGSLALLFLGAVFLTIGIIYMNSVDMSKYYRTASMSESYTADNIKSVKIDLSAGRVAVIRSYDDKVHIEGSVVPDDSSVEIKGDVLDIDFAGRDGIYFGIWGLNNNILVDAEVYLPDKIYDKLDIDGGAGNITVEDISCGKVDIDAGAGDIDADNINADSLDISCGAGDVTVSNGVVKKLSMSAGAGNVTYSGTVNGNISVSTGAGDAELYLTNPKSDFNSGKYKLKTNSGVGDIKVKYDQ